MAKSELARWTVIVGAALTVLAVGQQYPLYGLPLWADYVVRGVGVLAIAAVWAAALPPSQASEVSRLSAEVESLRAEMEALRSQQGG